jgi:putative FmdB family regulatory protein
MPLYEYECFLCGHRFERIQRASAAPIEVCPECGGSVRRLLGVPALQFKGSGWYVTDYGSGRSRGTTSAGNGNGSSAAGADNGHSSTKTSSGESKEG